MVQAVVVLDEMAQYKQAVQEHLDKVLQAALVQQPQIMVQVVVVVQVRQEVLAALPLAVQAVLVLLVQFQVLLLLMVAVVVLVQQMVQLPVRVVQAVAVLVVPTLEQAQQELLT